MRAARAARLRPGLPAPAGRRARQLHRDRRDGRGRLAGAGLVVGFPLARARRPDQPRPDLQQRSGRGRRPGHPGRRAGAGQRRAAAADREWDGGASYNRSGVGSSSRATSRPGRAAATTSTAGATMSGCRRATTSTCSAATAPCSRRPRRPRSRRGSIRRPSRSRSSARSPRPTSSCWPRRTGCAVAERNLRSAEQILGAYRARLTAGTANLLDVSQQEALVAGQRASCRRFRNTIEQNRLALGILVGPAAGAAGHQGRVARGAAGAGGRRRVCRASLLARRPDVAYAEAQLRAQNANITRRPRRLLSRHLAHRLGRADQRGAVGAHRAGHAGRPARGVAGAADLRQRPAHRPARSWPRAATTNCSPTIARRCCRRSPTWSSR